MGLHLVTVSIKFLIDTVTPLSPEVTMTRVTRPRNWTTDFFTVGTVLLRRILLWERSDR